MPFTSSFAVTAGRSIIEVTATGATTVHDYRPATHPTWPVPTAFIASRLCAPPDTGPKLMGHGGVRSTAATGL